ncbi:hypothetical protein EDB83DRAFT_145500 [Lactarius deliciosus]|nr:hypothetical protein EDB83DRAFT_145500 [Lactarius deliciosus]
MSHALIEGIAYCVCFTGPGGRSMLLSVPQCAVFGFSRVFFHPRSPLLMITNTFLQSSSRFNNSSSPRGLPRPPNQAPPDFEQLRSVSASPHQGTVLAPSFNGRIDGTVPFGPLSGLSSDVPGQQGYLDRGTQRTLVEDVPPHPHANAATPARRANTQPSRCDVGRPFLPARTTNFVLPLMTADLPTRLGRRYSGHSPSRKSSRCLRGME